LVISIITVIWSIRLLSVVRIPQVITVIRVFTFTAFVCVAKAIMVIVTLNEYAK
jgi:hypothetical protein